MRRIIFALAVVALAACNSSPLGPDYNPDPGGFTPAPGSYNPDPGGYNPDPGGYAPAKGS